MPTHNHGMPGGYYGSTRTGLPPGFDKVSNFGTGVSLNSETCGFFVTDRLFIFPSATTLTESTATAVATIAVPANTVVGGVLFYSIESNDGTDYQVLSGQIPFGAVNKAGTLTADIGTAVEKSVVSTGTLTNTVTITTGTNSVTLKLAAVSSLTQTTLRATCSGVMNGGLGPSAQP